MIVVRVSKAKPPLLDHNYSRDCPPLEHKWSSLAFGLNPRRGGPTRNCNGLRAHAGTVVPPEGTRDLYESWSTQESSD